MIDSKVLACGSNKKLSKHKTIPHASLIIIKIGRLLSNLRLTLFYFCMHRFGFFAAAIVTRWDKSESGMKPPQLCIHDNAAGHVAKFNNQAEEAKT